MSMHWTPRLPSWLRKRIEGREQLQNVINNITWLSLDKVLRLGVGLFVGVWVARYLGAQRFGELNFAQAFVVLFSPLALLGLDSIAIRDMVREPARQDTTLGTCLALRLAGSIVAIVMAMVAMFILRPEDVLMQWLVVIAGVAFLFQTFDVIDLWFQARVQSKFVVYARNAAFLCVAAVKVGLIFMEASLLAFALAALIEIILASIGLVFFYTKQNRSIRNWKVETVRAKELLRESWPLFLAVISIAIYMRIDQVMLGSLLGDKQVGIYTVAIKMVEIWYFIPMTIVSSLYPALINARAHDEQFYHRRLQILYDTMSVIACGIAVVTSFFSEAIISLLYGAEFAGAAPVLSIYAWASIPVFLGVASNQNLVIQNRTRVTLNRTLAGAVVNVLLNVVLIPRYGAHGAAIASLISYTTATFFFGLEKDSWRQMGMLFMSLNPLRWIRISEKLRNA
jgi:PST family polysaccharide transporter